MMGNFSFKQLLAITCMFGAIGISGGSMAAGYTIENLSVSTTKIYGSLADARNAESVQYMRITDGGSWMYIYAHDDVNYNGCFTSDAAIITLVRSANSDTRLDVDISDGLCTNVLLDSSSLYAPKKIVNHGD